MSHEIVTVGGGNGSPIVNEALLRTTGINSINAVAAVYDSGGATGRRRLDSLGQELAYSDAMRILLSLVPPEQKETDSYRAVYELFNHRDGRGKVLGQDIFNRYFDEKDGFSGIEQGMKAFGINLKGHVLPSSTQPSNIAFITSSGRNYSGEHLLDDNRMSKDLVIDMYLDPSVDAYVPATDAVERAGLIVLSCGSLHGSLFSNFLPTGMREALSKSQAKMFLVTNLVSSRNETHDYTPMQFVDIVKRYTGKKPDGLIVPEISRKEFEHAHPDVAGLYDLEHSHFLGWESRELYAVENQGVQIITHQATRVVEGQNGYKVVRHDPKGLSDALGKIISS